MQLILSWRQVILMIFSVLIIHSHDDRMSSTTGTRVLHTVTWAYFTSHLPDRFISSPKIVKEAIMTDVNVFVQQLLRMLRQLCTAKGHYDHETSSVPSFHHHLRPPPSRSSYTHLVWPRYILHFHLVTKAIKKVEGLDERNEPHHPWRPLWALINHCDRGADCVAYEPYARKCLWLVSVSFSSLV